jgi:hypothetical protein
VRREETKTNEKEDQPKDQESDERFGSFLPNRLGEKSARITDLRGEYHSLPQPPLVAWVCRFQGKQHIFEPLQ